MNDITLSKNLLFIYNPYSGKGKIKYFLDDIINKLCSSKYKVTIYATQKNKDATNIISELCSKEKYDIIVCSGGDGTLDEVVKGILSNNLDIKLGYIPSGTVNDFARSMNIPTDMLEAVNIIIEEKVFKCDIGSMNNKCFTYVAAFGAFTSVAYSTDQDLKNILGKLAYFLEGTKQLTDIPSYKLKITVNNEIIEDEFILGMITNSISVGGMKTVFLEDSEFNDGLFEVTLIKKPKNILELRETARALIIRDFNNTDSIIKIFKTDKIDIESDKEIAWTLDGEDGGEYRNVNIQNHKEVLRIIVGGGN